MLLGHGAAFCTTPCWWANGWCFASAGPAGSTGPGSEVPWDCTAHILPYLKYLHAWLLKVGASMPSIMRPVQLAAPVEVRIDHALLQKNEDRHETWHKKQNPNPSPKDKVQEPRSHREGPRSKVQGFIWGRKSVLRCHVPSLEDKLRTAFLRRDLLAVPVATKPRPGTDLLISNKEFLGTHELMKTSDAEVFMSAQAMGLTASSESWWVVSSGRWYPSYYYNSYNNNNFNYYYYYYYRCYYY